jgi:hypothetical protein
MTYQSSGCTPPQVMLLQSETITVQSRMSVSENFAIGTLENGAILGIAVEICGIAGKSSKSVLLALKRKDRA